ncbi:MAG: phosphatase PAP2 family protein [Sphingomonadales bacterium]|nr:phosphatase PAP2 family protein [Sphingomonadales bacterium]
MDVALIRDGIAARMASPLPTEAGLFLNYAGGVAATLGIGTVAALLLWFRGRVRRAVLFAAVVLGGRLLIEAIKLIVHRARPALDPHPVLTHSLSFPSVHAGNSMIAFLALALFFAPAARRGGFVLLAVLASLVIGSSRSLIGVHWPSDVLAGWSIGAAWILATWPIASRLTSDKAEHDVVGGHRPVLGEE